MRSGEEIQVALRGFARKWAGYSGGERSEAQTFLNELFACYGSDRLEVGARFEDFTASAGFMDLHWPGECIVEMKAPTKEVSSAREQVKRYWEESADEDANTPAARWVVLCNFTSFEVWEPGRFPKSPRAVFELTELSQRYEALMFLAGPALAPSFLEHHKELTAEAAKLVAQVYQSLVDRSAAPLDEIQRFTLQTVWTLFAEDLDLLVGSPLQNIVEALRQDPKRSPAAELGFLFRVLNQKTNHNRTGVLAGTRYVNGDLFRDPAEVDLTRAELDLLAQAAEQDWSKVDPTIFGSLMEGVIGRERRWELGAHYTHEADIMKIVEPTVIRPWRERIDAATTPNEARRLLDELTAFVVLDPACGCGNFLYIAYRELRGLEHHLKTRIRDLAASTGQPLPPEPWPYVPLTNLRGIDIEPISVLIARVTLWMGHRQMIDRYGEAENPLPLVSLAGITIGDAVFDPWPACNAIVGNPPFVGDRKLRRAYGVDYLDRLRTTFNVGLVDYCAYWFRRAQTHLGPGQRAGLVSTNTLRENKHRLASLDYIAKSGGVITDAISSQKWPGEAKVYVSITNWIKDPADPVTHFTLDGVPTTGITPQLKPGLTAPEPRRLAANKGRSFIGCQPTGKGFILDEETASALIDDGEGRVIRPYLVSEDITDSLDGHPRRWVIDFDQMSLEEARKYPGSLAIVRRLVKPEREDNNERHFRRLWWQFAWPRPRMRSALEGKSRFITATRVGKRFSVAWADSSWCPGDSVCVIPSDDDYSMGILASRANVSWAWFRSSSYGKALRYTPSTAFETFSWPQPTAMQKTIVSQASKALMNRRAAIVAQEEVGLTELYNRVGEGAYADLAKLHRALDEAVAVAYSWPKSVAQNSDEIVRRLGELNTVHATDPGNYNPFDGE